MAATFQPFESGSFLELFGKRLRSRRPNINCLTGMMFAISGQCAGTSDFFKTESLGKFALDDAALILKAAKS